MKRHLSLPFLLGLLIMTSAVLALSAKTTTALPEWQKPIQPPASSLKDLARHPVDPAKVLLASPSVVFEAGSGGQWNQLWSLPGTGNEIHKIVTPENLPGAVILLTRRAVFCGRTADGQWHRIYQSRTDTEAPLSFAVLPGDPDHWFLGTTEGLYESDNAGRSWFRFGRFPSSQSVVLLRFAGDALLAAVQDQLYLSKNLADFRTVFSLSSGYFEEAEDEAFFDNGEDGALREKNRLHALAAEPSGKTVWLGTSRGIFESRNGGLTWKPFPSAGLLNTGIRHLIYAAKHHTLIAGTDDGVYLYDSGKSLWGEAFRGLARRAPQALSLAGRLEDSLAAVTPEGLVFLPLEVEPPSPQPVRVDPDRLRLFHLLLREEPSVRKVQKAVLSYANTGNGKISRWHKLSRISALAPSFSFGTDFSENNNIDIDRGSTSTPDTFIAGPADTDQGWDVDVSWDFSDLIWSSNQTSIDSREKLMVELRHDLLSEATRIYYERRRLQTALLFSPPATAQEHLERLLHMDELTGLLDAMTDGLFGKDLREVYRRHPELAVLWQDIPSPESVSIIPAASLN